jgi:site-specific DNA-methyltransferase (adenine-specific)
MNRSTINLHLGDSLEAMKLMPDNAYDLAIVDPPYGISVSVSMGRRKGDKKSDYHKFAGEDKEAPSLEYFTELFRVSKNQIVWGANHFISKMPFDSSCWLMWDKGFSEDVTFAQFELAWTSFTSTCKKFDKHPSQQNRIHPTQKPVKLYEWLLSNYAKEGDKILDTHGGSMSIALACHNLKFDLDLWELDEDYHAAGVKRFEQHKKQLQLF